MADNNNSGACVTFLLALLLDWGAIAQKVQPTYPFPPSLSLYATLREGETEFLYVFFLLLLILGQTPSTYTAVRPQGSVYQEMISAINKYRKTILSVVRTATALVNV